MRKTARPLVQSQSGRWYRLFMDLVFVAGALAVLCETLQSLVDEGDVLLVDVQSQQTETPCGAAADTV